MRRRGCALRTNRHESLSEAAKTTDVIATDAIKRELIPCFGHIDRPQYEDYAAARGWTNLGHNCSPKLRSVSKTAEYAASCERASAALFEAA